MEFRTESRAAALHGPRSCRPFAVALTDAVARSDAVVRHDERNDIYATGPSHCGCRRNRHRPSYIRGQANGPSFVFCELPSESQRRARHYSKSTTPASFGHLAPKVLPRETGRSTRPLPMCVMAAVAGADEPRRHVAVASGAGAPKVIKAIIAHDEISFLSATFKSMACKAVSAARSFERW